MLLIMKSLEVIYLEDQYLDNETIVIKTLESFEALRVTSSNLVDVVNLDCGSHQSRQRKSLFMQKCL